MEQVLQAPWHWLLAARGLQFRTFWNAERRCSAGSIGQVDVSAFPSYFLPFPCPCVSLTNFIQGSSLLFLQETCLYWGTGCSGLRWKCPDRPMFWIFGLQWMEVFAGIGSLEVLGGEAWLLEVAYWGQALGGCIVHLAVLLFWFPKEWMTFAAMYPCHLLHDIWALHQAFPMNGVKPWDMTNPSSSEQFLPGVLSKLWKSSSSPSSWLSQWTALHKCWRWAIFITGGNHLRSFYLSVKMSAFLSSKMKRKGTNSPTSSPFTTWIFNIHHFSMLSKFPC